MQGVLEQHRLIVEHTLLHFGERHRLVCRECRVTRTRRANLVFDLLVLRLQLFQIRVQLGRFFLQFLSRDIHAGQDVGNVLLLVQILLFALQQLRRNAFSDGRVGFTQEIQQGTGASLLSNAKSFARIFQRFATQRRTG